jgi:hypothetical protein
MTSRELPTQSDAGPQDDFYSGALDRIQKAILVLGVCLVPLAWLRFGRAPAAGFLTGAALSYLNFHSLARAVRGLGSRIVEAQSNEKGGVIVARFLLRYLVIGLVVYVTFVGWFGAFRGLLIGLCLPVAGMMGEAAYEFYAAFRRGI